MNNFKKYSLLFAIIFSVLIHLIIIKNFSFVITKSGTQESFDDIDIIIIKPMNSSPPNIAENLSNNLELVEQKPPHISKQKINIKHNSDTQVQKEFIAQEARKQSNKKPIDALKILSEIANMEFSDKTEKQNNQKRIKSISSNTSEYLYKLYFEAWRQKVEKIGAMNYPIEASKLGMFGSLRLTVSLSSDGSITNLFINKSSGYKELDEAALNIVKLGAPYAKFPAEIHKEVDIINITRKWKFTERNNFSK